MNLFLPTAPSYINKITEHSRELDGEAPTKKLNLTNEIPVIYSVSKLFGAHRKSDYICVSTMPLNLQIP